MTLAVDDSGTGGPVVVCLPMFGMTRVATAVAFAPAFAGTGLREVYPDLPGHGDSPAVCPARSVAVLETVCGWLDGYVDGPVLLAGGSYGGYLAAGIARRYPGRVAGLLLVNPGVRIAPSDRTLPEDAPPEAPAGWLDAAPASLREHFDAALGNRTSEVVSTVLAALDAGGPGDEAFLTELRGGAGYPLPDEDAEVGHPGPVSVVAGRQDGIVGYVDQFRAMDRYPRGTYTVVDSAGHYLPYEQPALLRALTHDWVRRIRA
ncbi:alpha/beta fold hydrolase [Micromonospora zhanjiangensis]|uniref:Alpha/beta fold hydrolase n=1 Tax=Micromonospora zhanjiangensis TaxID=1522057 RepID=A0ABV8KHL7_9ACTN